MTYEQKLEALSKDTTSLFLCEWGPDGDHATIVVGAAGVARQYYLDCLNAVLPPEVGIIEAVKEIFTEDTKDDCNEEWKFGHNGTATLELSFEDGTWRCAKITGHQLVTDLLPCPHCGSVAIPDECGFCEPPEYSVHCSNQECQASMHGFASAEFAMLAWNRRDGVGK